MKQQKNGIILYLAFIILFSTAFTFLCVYLSSISSKSTSADTPPVVVNTEAKTTPSPSTAPAPTADISEETQSNAPAEDEDKENEPPVVLQETEDMGDEYVSKFIFLGDSTTHGLKAYEIVGRNQVWTPPTGTMTLSQWSFSMIYYPDAYCQKLIVEATEDKKPEYMLITLGINGVSFMDEEYFTAEYTSLVKAIQQVSPDTKIILNSIYPVAAGYPTSYEIDNEKISNANKWIEQIAKSTGTRYLDSASVLKDDKGELREGYHNGDYLHLNKFSLPLVIEYLRTHGYQ